MARERHATGRFRRRRRVERVASAGGVVYRRRSGAIEVVLCGRDHDGVWGLPKGTPDEGESFEAAAIREVSEETGLQVAIQEHLGSIRYWFTRGDEGVLYDKTVHYYLMTASGGSVEQHDWEFDRVEWFALGEALRLITYKNERQMLEKAAQRLEGGGGDCAAPKEDG